MDFDCFKWDWMIFGIDNEYKDVYGDSYKLEGDFNGWLGEEKIEKCDYWAVNRPNIGVTSGENWQ